MYHIQWNIPAQSDLFAGYIIQQSVANLTDKLLNKYEWGMGMKTSFVFHPYREIYFRNSSEDLITLIFQTPPSKK